MSRKLLFAVFMLAAVPAIAAVTVTVNGSNHTIPQTNEKGWGTNVTAWIQAISQYTLQPSGGTFTLTADTDFGATYGLKSAYFKTRSSNPAGAGLFRLSNNESIGWRNAANGGNLLLKVNASDQLEYNGVVIAGSSGATFQDSTFNIFDNLDTTKKIAFQASGITTGTTRTVTMADADVDLADVSGATNANTASKIVKRDGSGNFSAGTITANLTGNVTGNLTGAVTGNASTASALAANPADCSAGQLATTIAANGDLTCTATPTLGASGSATGKLNLAGTTSGTITIQPQDAAGTYNFNMPTSAGSSGQVLTSGGGGSTAMTWTSPLTNPMDNQGQLIYGGVAGAATKLAAGSSGQYLESSGASAPTWKSIPRSRIRVEIGNGFGSTNTRIRRFTTSVVSTGSDITYADSATNGATFTLGSAGIYSATTCDYKAAGFCNSGISINSAQLTTNIESITNTARLGLQSQSGDISCVTATFIGAASDVIRAHGDNRCDGADTYVNFDIIKISN